MTVHVGVIGAKFGRIGYLPALAHIDEAEVVAISSQRLESAQAAAADFGIPAAYNDWRAMLESHRCDLVCIATPTDLHAPMTLAALDSGAHVLCEKPFAMNEAEARAMLERAETLGRIHMINHELRFNPNRRLIRDLIADGRIGEVRLVNIVTVTTSMGAPDSRHAGDWWSLEDRGGGRLGASGSHHIDLIRFWLGDVAAVRGEIATLAPDRVDPVSGEAWTATADDYTRFTLQMKSGVRATVLITSAARHALGNHTQIIGSEGTIVLGDGNGKLEFAAAGADFEDLTILDPNADLEGIYNDHHHISVVALMRELIAAVGEGRPLREGPTFLDGLKCQQVMDAVRRSSQDGCWIDLPD